MALRHDPDGQARVLVAAYDMGDDVDDDVDDESDREYARVLLISDIQRLYLAPVAGAKDDDDEQERAAGEVARRRHRWWWLALAVGWYLVWCALAAVIEALLVVTALASAFSENGVSYWPIAGLVIWAIIGFGVLAVIARRCCE